MMKRHFHEYKYKKFMSGCETQNTHKEERTDQTELEILIKLMEQPFTVQLGDDHKNTEKAT